MAAEERFVFPSLIEGYQKGLGDKFGERTKSKLKAAGLDMNKLPPAIPATDMLVFMRIIAAEAFPAQDQEEQLRQLGLGAIRGWQSGLLGSAAAAMIRIIGPRRALTRLDRAFSTTNNFSRATTAFVGEREALITVNDVQDMPTYWQGIFEAGLELLHLKGLVTLEPAAPPEGVFRVTWE